MCGMQLTGKTLGIVGMGRIGQAIACRLSTFKFKKLLYSTSGSTEKGPFGWEGVLPTEFRGSHLDIAREADIVIIACALTPQTRGLIDASFFKCMARDSTFPSTLFINIARGCILVQDDLIKALENNWVSLVGLDVTDPEPLDPHHPLLHQWADRCLVLPHIGSATVSTREAMADMALTQLLNHFDIKE